jgi:hypothetical protein
MMIQREPSFTILPSFPSTKPVKLLAELQFLELEAKNKAFTLEKSYELKTP